MKASIVARTTYSSPHLLVGVFKVLEIKSLTTVRFLANDALDAK
jgi:hypothetical protein